MERLTEILIEPNVILKDGETLIHILDDIMTVFSVEGERINKTTGKRDMVTMWLKK